jgi:dCMP deaminase
MQVSDVMSQRSRCSRAQIGAVIVSKDNRIVATGHNGAAATYAPSLFGPCTDWCPRARGETQLDASYDECPAIHAEENAIAYVDRSAVEGGTIIVTAACCMRCAKLISASGIRRVVMRVREADAHRHPDVVIRYFGQCGISVKVVNDNGS